MKYLYKDISNSKFNLILSLSSLKYMVNNNTSIRKNRRLIFKYKRFGYL